MPKSTRNRGAFVWKISMSRFAFGTESRTERSRSASQKRSRNDCQIVRRATLTMRVIFRCRSVTSAKSLRTWVVRKVVVFGSARVEPGGGEFEVAEAFAREMVRHNYMVITGGGDGIMGAAQRGAGRSHSFGLNIRLPFEQRANTIIEGDPKLINFNYFFTRKLNFVKETDALPLFPGGFGTLDETFEVLTLMQTGKARIIPVVLLDRPDGTYWETWMKFLTEHLFKIGFVSPEDFHLFKIVHNVDEAVAEILQFYKVYHSARWVGDKLVIRIRQRLSDKVMVDLNERFSDLVREGEIVQGKAFRQEKNEPEIWTLPRLILT